MPYKYASERQDYSDLSSGRVFYSLPGHPAFPVRLASEIFQRCRATRARLYSRSDPCTLYDPCCGAAYLLSIIAVLHGEHVRSLIGSDPEEKAVALAEKNLGLLTKPGLDRRIFEITEMIEQYNKDSHKGALESAHRLKQQMAESILTHVPSTKVFQASALDGETILKHVQAGSVDIVLTDVPYGQHSHWLDLHSGEANPIQAMLTALLDVLSSTSVVAIVSDKGQKIFHPHYDRIEHFKLGKRRIEILKPA